MRRWSLVVAASLAAVLALAACSDDGDDTSAPSTTTTAGTASTTAPTPAGPATATQCAELLFSAWATRSEARAPACAPPEQVQALFSQPYVGPYTGPACEPLAGELYCTWIGPDGLVIRVQDTAPFTVTNVTRRPA